MKLIATLAACAAAMMAADLGEGVRDVLLNSPAGRAFWGVQIVNLESGRTLFETNSYRLFTPASNTKLFTTALGLSRLGPDHRFFTRVLASEPPTSTGIVNGDLVLAGGGDPNLSARTIPYRMGPNTGNPLQAVEDLAAQVYAKGVRTVQGSIVGDDTWYPWEPYGDGWSADDGIWEYGAAVSALTVNDGIFALRLKPGPRPGDPVSVSLDPPVEFYYIDNRVRTVSGVEPKIMVDRIPGSDTLRVWGAIPAGARPQVRWLAVHDPALYAATAFRSALIRLGIAVHGKPLAKHAFLNEFQNLELAPAAVSPAGVELARHESAPLVEDLRITDKVSQNLHAEMILRAVGRARRNLGTRQAGLKELAAFLEEIGIDKTEYDFNDGSGLSRMNLVSPAAVVKLLRYMYSSPHRDTWLSLLPVAAEDGTLDYRFKGTSSAGRVRAKTGSLSHVNALSGYAQTRSAGMVVFSILVNNSAVPSSEVRAAIDRIVNLVVE